MRRYNKRIYSQYHGVSWQCNAWRVRYTDAGKLKQILHIPDEYLAAEVYDLATLGAKQRQQPNLNFERGHLYSLDAQKILYRVNGGAHPVRTDIGISLKDGLWEISVRGLYVTSHPDQHTAARLRDEYIISRGLHRKAKMLLNYPLEDYLKEIA